MARILLIEDDDLVRRMLLLTLSRAGHEVIEAANGDVGLAFQRSQPADLILTDIIMPERDGIEALMELRRRRVTTPVIAMSGGGRISATDYLVVAQKLGAFTTLSKPIDAATLLAAVDSALATTNTAATIPPHR